MHSNETQTPYGPVKTPGILWKFYVSYIWVDCAAVGHWQLRYLAQLEKPGPLQAYFFDPRAIGRHSGGTPSWDVKGQTTSRLAIGNLP